MWVSVCVGMCVCVCRVGMCMFFLCLWLVSKPKLILHWFFAYIPLTPSFQRYSLLPYIGAWTLLDIHTGFLLTEQETEQVRMHLHVGVGDWQVDPAHPLAQSHVNPFTSSVHVPPLAHGEEAHSSISEEAKGFSH